MGAEDFDTWAAYIYFAGENDLQLSRDNYIPIFRGEIVAYERLSDGLAAFLVSYLDSEDTPVSECLHFVGRYDGRLYVFRNKASLPEELCSALEKLTLPDPFEDDPDIMIRISLPVLCLPILSSPRIRTSTRRCVSLLLFPPKRCLRR